METAGRLRASRSRERATRQAKTTPTSHEHPVGKLLVALRDEMRRYKANELAGRDDLGLLPKPRKMPRVSSHEIIRAGGISAFEEYVVVGVASNQKVSHRNNPMGAFSDEL